MAASLRGDAGSAFWIEVRQIEAWIADALDEPNALGEIAFGEDAAFESLA
ncbi:MAG TPA: hypothetical protein VNJ05_09960 [Sphingomicrobium sp.]|nr:hypothetical protein [Sphingomicrobium sp.]